MSAENALPLPKRCGSYEVGHETHHIQARMSWEDHSFTPGRATVDGDGWITVDTDDGQLRRWTHDPDRLRAVLGEHGPAVEVRSNYVLAVPHIDAAGRRSSVFISVAMAPSCCPSRPAKSEDLSIHDLFVQIKERGGFLVHLKDIKIDQAAHDV